MSEPAKTAARASGLRTISSPKTAAAVPKTFGICRQTGARIRFSPNTLAISPKIVGSHTPHSKKRTIKKILEIQLFRPEIHIAPGSYEYMSDKHKLDKNAYQDGDSAALQISGCECVKFQDLLAAGHKSGKILHDCRDSEKDHVNRAAADRDF